MFPWLKLPVKRVFVAAVLSSVLPVLTIAGIFLEPVSGNPYGMYGPPPPKQIPTITIGRGGVVVPVPLEFPIPIIGVGRTYLFTRDIADYRIKVECSNIVINGNGFTLQEGDSLFASDALPGIELASCSNVTIKNLTVKQAAEAIVLNNANSSTITKTNITNCGAGIRIEEGSYNSIYANKITGSRASFLVFRGYNNTFYGNYVANNVYGASIVGIPAHLSYFEEETLAANNTIFHNSFINSTYLIWRNSGAVYGTNLYDDGSLGNYWSDYVGNDTDNDGVGDTPYLIGENFQDRYPLVFPLGAAWNFSLSLPLNRTYFGGVPLVFYVDRPTSWLGYSLDGQENVTITENTTLILSGEGWHTVTIYANDTLGTAAIPATSSFFVDTQTAFFQTLLIAVSVAFAWAVAGAGVLLHHRKRRREAGQT